jgi:hypothetical protein
MATPAGAGRLPPSKAMIAGYGAVPDEGYVIDAVKDIDFPESPQLIVKVFPEIDAVRVAGLPGKVPSSYRWSKSDISAWRQSHWSFVVTLFPLNVVKRSLSLESVFKVIELGRAVQVAPPPGVEVEVPDEDD